MDNTSWMVPPGAAQPVGIQSTAGAVPIWNEKGELSMKKVKVQRYISGKRPEYAPDSPEHEETDDEDFTHPKTATHPASPQQKTLTAAEMQDPRLRRLRASHNEAHSDRLDYDRQSNRVHHKAEVVEMSDQEEDFEQDRTDEFSHSHKLPESDSESEGEIDEDELALRRMRMRDKAMQKIEEEQEVLGKEEEGSEESSEDESSEYTEESDSEEEGPRLKPVFVRKKDRVTIHQKDAEMHKAKQMEVETKKRSDERRRDTLRIIEAQHRQQAVAQSQTSDVKENDINTDDEADDAEYEGWKVRELRRLKRDKEERELFEKEKEDVDKFRNMNEDERRLDLRNNPKQVTNKAVKGKYKFLQKYYHRGAFFLDNEQEVFKRDFSGATLEDHFDKTVLPKVMQVKNFGRSGRTKYTHLVDQDTTCFESPWAADTQMNHKFSNASSGGIKQVFDKPSQKRPPPSSSSSSSNFRNK